MVVTTGLAMISFVLLGAVSDPRDMPMPLVIIFLAAMVGGIFGLAGMSRGKGVDWGLSGVITGAALGIVLLWSSQEPSAVVMQGGNLTRTQLSELMRQRQIANTFVQMAATAELPEDPKSDLDFQAHQTARMQVQRNIFGFTSDRDITAEDVVLGEVLRREADQMGMIISDDVVRKFIKDLTGGKLSREAFSEIRRTLQVSEKGIFDALKAELKARNAARLLTGQTHITPQNRWEFFKQLNVTQSAELVAIPVSNFYQEGVEPTADELQNLLNQYRENTPGFTPDGRPDEGRPGFFQPPKVQLAYLEAVFDTVKASVGEVTDEEIRARYDEQYPETAVPEDDATDKPAAMPEKEGAATPGLPTLPAPGTPASPPPADAPTDDKPEAEAKPEADKPAEPAAEPEKPAAPQADEPAKPDQKPNEPQADEPKSEEPTATPDESSSSSRNDVGRSLSPLQFVAFQEPDAPTAEPQAEPTAETKTETPAAEQPAGDKPETPAAPDATPPATTPEPAADTPAPAAPASEKSESEKSESETPTSESPENPPALPAPQPGTPLPALGTDGLPPAPEVNRPALDDELKEELREEILRERTQLKVVQIMEEAQTFASSLAQRYRLGADDENYISLEKATEEIRKYAEEHQLEFIETPFLPLQDLRNSEDYPVGSAFVMSPGDPRGMRTVADDLFQSSPMLLFNVNQARRFSFGEAGASESRYIFWKTGFKDAYAPKTIDDEERVRAQVLTVWKRQNADEATRKRAEAIADLVRNSDKPMSEALAEETVTGTEGSLYLTVRETGDFSKRTRGMVNPSNPFQTPPPRYSIVTGAEDAGIRFFNLVCDALQPGEVGIAPNREGSVYYVVKVTERNPADEAGWSRLRSRFLEEFSQMPSDMFGFGNQMTYEYLGQELLSQFGGDWGRQLFDKYEVRFFNSDRNGQREEL